MPCFKVNCIYDIYLWKEDMTYFYSLHASLDMEVLVYAGRMVGCK